MWVGAGAYVDEDNNEAKMVIQMAMLRSCLQYWMMIPVAVRLVGAATMYLK